MTPLELPGLELAGDASSWALFSPCGHYRYALGRAWAPALPTFAVFMLNPSTADHRRDDRTIRKVLHFARQEGCGSILVRNLAAWRATDPAELELAPDCVGAHNVEVLRVEVQGARRVAAWGALLTRPRMLHHYLARSVYVVKSRPLEVLALTADDEPRHPLYLPNATRLCAWR